MITVRRVAGLAISAILAFGTSARSDTMTTEQMAAVIQKLQSRVDALEARSRQDRADAAAAKAELRAARGGRAVRHGGPLTPTPAAEAYPTAVPAAPVALISKDPGLYLAPPPNNGFDGFYAAVVGGYQFGTARQYQGGVYSSADIDALQGGSIGGALGFNTTSGHILIGLEGRARRSFEEVSASGEATYSEATLPRLVSTGCCTSTPGIRPLAPGEVGNFILSSKIATRDTIKREYGGDVSARIGMIFDETLVYVRVGAGANAVTNQFVSDQSGTVTCIQPTGYSETSLFGLEQKFVTGCASRASGPVTKSVGRGTQPYSILGLGIEHNFGPYFARAEGAVMNHFSTGSGASYFAPHYTTEVTGAVGMRF